MRQTYEEPCFFETTVVEVKGGPRNCRVGHEEGDAYAFGYGTPDGLCGELYHHLFPILQAMRAGGDMRTFRGDAPSDGTAGRPAGSDAGGRAGGGPDEILVWCPSRVVRLRVRALRR